MKELVIASLFLTARKLIPSILWTNNLRGPDIPERIEANKKQFAGTELLGKRIGIVGLGAIGASLANTLHELGMHGFRLRSAYVRRICMARLESGSPRHQS